VIRTRLRYHRPSSDDEASELLARHEGDVAVLGGGTWLLPLMGRGEIAVANVVDLRGVGLQTIRVSANHVEVGAMATYEDVLASAELAAAVPLLANMAAGVTGGRQLRNQATLVGSACYANPSSEAPAVLVALDATLRLHGPSGARDLPAAEFFQEAFVTALRPGEFVSSFTVARRDMRSGYVKVKISAGSWPVATAAALLDRATGEASVTVGAVEGRPLRLELSPLSDGNGRLRTEEVAALVSSRVTDPWGDVLASPEYRREVAGVVARRAAEQLQEAQA
jgi:carbon-monoxide dehydrogenase medium subunit